MVVILGIYVENGTCLAYGNLRMKGHIRILADIIDMYKVPAPD